MKVTRSKDNSALHTTATSTSTSKLPPPRTSSPRKPRPDLPKKPSDRKPPRRRLFSPAARTPRLHQRKDGGGTSTQAAGARRAGPPTPLLRWKFDEVGWTDLENGRAGVDGKKSSPAAECADGGGRRKPRRGATASGGRNVSARKLAAALWRMQVTPEMTVGQDEVERHRRSRRNEDQLGFKRGPGHVGDWLASHHNGRGFYNESKDPRSPCSVNGPVNGYICEPQGSIQFSNYAMEGVTKWDPVHPRVPEEKHDKSPLLEKNLNAGSMVSTLQAELERARSRIEELETDRRSSKKKMERFLRKLSEERAAWRSREHEKVRAIIDDMKSDLSRERKNRQRLEIVNSKLVNELAESKLLAKRYMQDYEKEKKNRELVEEVCDELAKEIGEDKAEVDALRKESSKVREEMEDERKMLQMAEVWREERVQMKLIDAKVMLEDRFSQMNQLMDDLKWFLKSNGATLDGKEVKEAEKLLQVAGSVTIQDIKELTYEPPKSNDIYSVFEEMAMMGGDTSEREIEPCVTYSPAASHSSKIHTVSPEEEAMIVRGDKIYRLSNVYGGSHNNGHVFDDDDRSGWETVSQADQGSCYSHDGSTASVSNKKMILHRDSNVSAGSGSGWEENGNESPMTEISEVCSVRSKQQLKKVTSISRLWRSSYPHNNGSTGDSKQYKIVSMEGVNGGRISNGRVSNGGIMASPDFGSGGKAELVGHWNSSPDTRSNPHVGRGKKGCIEWPRGQKNSLKAKLLEARMECQKIQLRHVLEQKF